MCDKLKIMLAVFMRYWFVDGFCEIYMQVFRLYHIRCWFVLNLLASVQVRSYFKWLSYEPSVSPLNGVRLLERKPFFILT